MEKPVAHKIEAHDIISITEYIMDKYNLDLSLDDVWHWFVDNYEPDNGTKVTLETEIYEDDEEWVKTMKTHLEKEFGKEITLLVQW